MYKLLYFHCIDTNPGTFAKACNTSETDLQARQLLQTAAIITNAKTVLNDKPIITLLVHDSKSYRF